MSLPLVVTTVEYVDLPMKKASEYRYLEAPIVHVKAHE